jgi:uncharacterized protein YecE (DUF72 family)
MPLSPLIRFGSSTWTYEGWQGIVYTRPYPKGRFKQDCLAEYARYRYKDEILFRTVGFDFTFYGPPTARQLEHYAAQLPAGFVACSKVWEEVTVPIFPPGLRYRSKTGPNPHFLDVDYFVQQVLPPYQQAFRDHTGPFIFEFQRTGIESEEFLPKLDVFLGKLPKDYEYAVEVRNSRLLGPEYQALLRRHAVAHVYNHLTALPPLWRQHQLLGETFTGPFIMLRLLTPRDLAYGQAVKAYQPYNRIIRALPEMRNDTVRLVREAVSQRRPTYVLVNNRSEGSAPLTIQALADQLQSEGHQVVSDLMT